MMVALNAPTPAQPNGWGVVPAELICDPKIKDGAIRLYAFLATRCYNAGKDDRNVLTRKEIATYLEISESTVTNRVRELVERDWILVWEVGRSNAYMTYKTTKECREARDANPERAYVIFDKLPDLRVTRVNVDRGNQLPLSKRAKKVKTDVKLVQPVTQTGVTGSLNTDNQLPHSKHVSLIQNKKEINTDVSNDTSPADAGHGDPTPQEYHMVSDHVDGSGEMVEAESVNDGALVERIEDPPSVPDVSPTENLDKLQVVLWNANVKFTACMAIGDTEMAKVGFVVTAVKSTGKISVPPPTISGWLMNMVKTLLINISNSDPSARSISTRFEVQSGVLYLEPKHKEWIDILSGGLSCSIWLPEIQQIIWVGLASSVEPITPTQVSLTLTAFTPKYLAANMWLEICKYFAPTATDAKAKASNSGNDTYPSPNRVTVNANNTTIIKPHDPIFDSVAKLQFGIADTSDMPMTTTKTGKRRSVFGARIQAIVNVIVDQYKLRNNVTALTTQEREGLAAIHGKFWTWYTEVKYPARNGETLSQLRDDEKFAEYWIEYRAYRNAPKAEPPQDVIPIARVGITTELPKAGGEWGKR